MDLATGAMADLLPKLGDLLNEEYELQRGAREDVEFLKRELASMYLAVRKVGEVPRDQLDEQVKQWAGEVRELSYQMEDVLDRFLVHVDGGPDAAANSNKLINQLMEKTRGMFKKWKARRQIAGAIKSIKERVQEVADRRHRYRVDEIITMPASSTTVDPRLRALYIKATELIGINGKSAELKKLLHSSTENDDVSTKELKIISVVGFGGLGKTTLVKTVYDNKQRDFDFCAFVPVGRNADLKRVLLDILIDLGNTDTHLTILNERKLIDNILTFLYKKRYLIVIDDIWEENLWKSLKCAFPNGDCGSRVITTTRIISISKACCSSSDDAVYEMKPLSSEDSQRLFYKRIFQSEISCPPELQKVSKDILKKCGGVPLAIITIASLLASDQGIKSNTEWHILLKSIGRGLTEDASVEEMQRILSFSYYDLPSHLKTCLLYISAYPENSMINKDQLIWKWISENFVQCKPQGIAPFELGESYFNELINRSMIEPVYDDENKVEACRVHDMVLDLIYSLSTEENFVTIYDGIKDCTSSPCIRRLSIQDRNKHHERKPLVCMGMSQVRSVTGSNLASCLLPSLSNFEALRVLDLGECNLGESRHLNLGDVGKLIHLRYLGLAHAHIHELPEEIGKLQFLLVIDVRGNSDLKELPSSILKLRVLVALYIEGCFTRLPDGFGYLPSIEILDGIIASLNNVKELRRLARLKVLNVSLRDKNVELQEAFVDCLCSLHNVQSLVIDCSGPIYRLWERWVPPPHLRAFNMSGYFSKLPTWIEGNSYDLSNLSRLCIWVMELQQDNLLMLGRLSALHFLKIRTIHLAQRLRLMGVHGFHSIIFFELYCSSPGTLVFEKGALPKAEIIWFDSNLRIDKNDGNGKFYEGPGNLRSKFRSPNKLWGGNLQS